MVPSTLPVLKFIALSIFLVSLIGWSLTLYGVSEKPPFHRPLQKLHPEKEASHPLASLIEQNAPSRSKQEESQKAVSTLFTPTGFAVELDASHHHMAPPPPPPVIPQYFGPEFLDPWDDFQPADFLETHKQKWFFNHDMFRSPYGVPPRRANAPQASNQYYGYPNYQGPDYSGGNGLERLNTPRKTNSYQQQPTALWQRMDLSRQLPGSASALRGSDDSSRGSSKSTVFSIFYTFFLCLHLLH